VIFWNLFFDAGQLRVFLISLVGVIAALNNNPLALNFGCSFDFLSNMLSDFLFL